MRDIESMLRYDYGINSLDIEQRAGGFSARAYKVTAADEVYFLKAYDKTSKAAAQWIARIDRYIPVLCRLNDHPGLRGGIAEPVRTRSGACKAQDCRSVYVVFRYIDGETLGDSPLSAEQACELGQLVGMLHQHKAQTIPGDYSGMTEDFRLPFCSRLSAVLQGGAFDEDVQAILQGCRPRLVPVIDTLERAAIPISAAKPDCVFCHTDIHGYNLMQGERLVLVDWEGLKLAPPEHDLSLVAGEPYFEDFMRAYGAYHPGFALRAELMDFYRMRRRLEDIEAFATRLLHEALEPDERSTNLRLLKALCESPIGT